MLRRALIGRQQQHHARHYKNLGLENLDRTPTASEVKQAYREKTRQHHPDTAGGDAKEFQKVKDSYEILMGKKQDEQNLSSPHYHQHHGEPSQQDGSDSNGGNFATAAQRRRGSYGYTQHARTEPGAGSADPHRRGHGFYDPDRDSYSAHREWADSTVRQSPPHPSSSEHASGVSDREAYFSSPGPNFGNPFGDYGPFTRGEDGGRRKHQFHSPFTDDAYSQIHALYDRRRRRRRFLLCMVVAYCVVVLWQFSKRKHDAVYEGAAVGGPGRGGGGAGGKWKDGHSQEHYRKLAEQRNNAVMSTEKKTAVAAGGGSRPSILSAKNSAERTKAIEQSVDDFAATMKKERDNIPRTIGLTYKGVPFTPEGLAAARDERRQRTKKQQQSDGKGQGDKPKGVNDGVKSQVERVALTDRLSRRKSDETFTLEGE